MSPLCHQASSTDEYLIAPATEQPCAGHILWQGRLVRFAATENCKQENMRIMRTNVPYPLSTKAFAPTCDFDDIMI